MIPEEILKELATMQQRYAEIYHSIGVCGLMEWGVQLTTVSFLETFGEYEAETRDDPKWPEKLTAELNGTTFFCVR